MIFIGAIFGSFFHPSKKAKSLSQHLISGILFGTISLELIPKVLVKGQSLSLFIGFILGALFMIFLEKASTFFKKKELSTLFGLSTDLFIDGSIITIAFFTSYNSGLIVSTAFAIEVFFLGLITKTLFTKITQTTILFALSLFLGSLFGYTIFPYIHPTGLLAFGISCLLFIITEDFLKEAHETKDTFLGTSLFFVGFILILLMKSFF